MSEAEVTKYHYTSNSDTKLSQKIQIHIQREENTKFEEVYSDVERYHVSKKVRVCLRQLKT